MGSINYSDAQTLSAICPSRLQFLSVERKQTGTGIGRSNAQRYLPLAPRLYHYLSRRLHTAISFASYTPPSLISLASYVHRLLFRRVYTAISLASAEDRPSLRLETWLGWPRACTSRRHLHFRWACVRDSVHACILCVCVGVCVCVCVCVCTYGRTYVRMYVHTRARTHKYTHTHVHITCRQIHRLCVSVSNSGDASCLWAAPVGWR